MIRGCVVLDGYLNIFEMVNCDQEKERADGLSGQNAGGREDYPAGIHVAAGRNTRGRSEPSPFLRGWKSIMFKWQIPSIRWKCDF